MPGPIRSAVDRLLGRAAPRPTTPEPREDRSWKAGDIAECIHPGPWFQHTPQGTRVLFGNAPEFRERYRVTNVQLQQSRPNQPVIVLQFRAWPGDWFAANAFRKVVPIADRAECADSAFLQQLRHDISHQPERV